MSQKRDNAFRAVEKAKTLHNLTPKEIEIAQKFALGAYGYDDEQDTEIHNYIKALNEASKNMVTGLLPFVLMKIYQEQELLKFLKFHRQH